MTAADRGVPKKAKLNGAGDAATKVVTPDMVSFCFDVLHSHLVNHHAHPTAPNRLPKQHYPLFVTWKIGRERKLRGCIGTFNSTDLKHGLREYAITSALKDSRFNPITIEEVSNLHCSVSLLTDFEQADHYLDWQIGVHGIRIEFHNERGSRKAATYLPEVAREQGWDHLETIDSLLRKGGYRAAISDHLRNSITVVRFQSDKLTLSYSDYLEHKRQAPMLPNAYYPPEAQNSMNSIGESSNSSSSSSSLSNGHGVEIDHRHNNGMMTRARNKIFGSLGVGTSPPDQHGSRRQTPSFFLGAGRQSADSSPARHSDSSHNHHYL